MSQLQPDQTKTSKVPLATLLARVVTVTTLAVSIVIMKMNNVTYKIDSDTFHFPYTQINAYRFMVFSNVVGFAYNLLQIPFAIYYLKTGKRLINHYGLLQFDFYGDKVISLVVAIGVGAAFGATSDVKKSIDNARDKRFRKYFGSNSDLSDYTSKLDDFFNMAYASAALLLIGFLSSAFSSIISSMALNKKA